MNYKIDPETWLELAEILFLDTEHEDDEWEKVAVLLKARGWTRDETEQTLVELIAPAVGANAGYMVYPVIGEWAGFDSAVVEERVRQRIHLRKKRCPWQLWARDRHSRWMLRKLGVHRLLDRL